MPRYQVLRPFENYTPEDRIMLTKEEAAYWNAKPEFHGPVVEEIVEEPAAAVETPEPDAQSVWVLDADVEAPDAPKPRRILTPQEAETPSAGKPPLHPKAPAAAKKTGGKP